MGIIQIAAGIASHNLCFHGHFMPKCQFAGQKARGTGCGREESLFVINCANDV
jgi:hypothetical protein